MPTININWLAGEPFQVDFEAAETLLDLKKKIEVKQGIKPERQSLYFMGYIVTEDETNVEELMRTIGEDSATLVLPKAGSGPLAKNTKNQFIDEETFLINGDKHNFKTERIMPNRQKTIKLKSKKFGISYHVAGEKPGQRVYQVEVYRVKEVASIKLSQRDDGKIKVVLIRVNGKGEEELVGEMEEYSEANLETHLDKAVKGFKKVGQTASLESFFANMKRVVFGD